MSRTTRWMSDLHEALLAKIIDGKRQPGSGNQFNGQMDVRNHPDADYAIAVDGKSTFSRTVSVTLDMIDKAIEQSHGLIPAIGMRWYADESGKNTTDWIAIPAADFREILDAARWTYEDVE